MPETSPSSSAKQSVNNLTHTTFWPMAIFSQHWLKWLCQVAHRIQWATSPFAGIAPKHVSNRYMRYGETPWSRRGVLRQHKAYMEMLSLKTEWDACSWCCILVLVEIKGQDMIINRLDVSVRSQQSMADVNGAPWTVAGFQPWPCGEERSKAARYIFELTDLDGDGQVTVDDFVLMGLSQTKAGMWCDHNVWLERRS